MAVFKYRSRHYTDLETAHHPVACPQSTHHGRMTLQGDDGDVHSTCHLGDLQHQHHAAAHWEAQGNPGDDRLAVSMLQLASHRAMLADARPLRLHGIWARSMLPLRWGQLILRQQGRAGGGQVVIGPAGHQEHQVRKSRGWVESYMVPQELLVIAAHGPGGHGGPAGWGRAQTPGDTQASITPAAGVMAGLVFTAWTHRLTGRCLAIHHSPGHYLMCSWCLAVLLALSQLWASD